LSFGTIFGHYLYSQTPIVKIKDPRTNKTRSLKQGWSWWFFFSPLLFGIPLFYYGLPVGGVGLLVMNFLSAWSNDVVVRSATPESSSLFVRIFCIASNVVTLGLQMWLGWRGSRIALKKYHKKGWIIV
jgi:hypothetical protein